MLNLLYSTCRYDFMAGPYVCIKERKSALRRLFPDMKVSGLTDDAKDALNARLLQICRTNVKSALPKSMAARVKLDDMEHSACEWNRTLKYGKLNPDSDDSELDD